MSDTSANRIEELLLSQHRFFASGQTKNHEYRITQLKKFKVSIRKYEKKITDALWKDLHKSYEESYLTEISLVLSEIDYHIRHLGKWVKPEKVPTPLSLWPSSSRIIREPLGVSLIIAPWNYPFQLLMTPLVGAISSGCCAVLKPSPYTPETAQVMEELIAQTFSPDYITVLQGGRHVNRMLLDQRFDFIFYSGSPAVGKVVMKAAAENLTPLVLELGGKSPCIVEADADLDVAAKRIAWGKLLNAGQTCIAPDYLFVQRSVREQLIKKIIAAMENMYGKDARQSNFYPRIVNQKSMHRLLNLMTSGKIIYGGESDLKTKYISPTLMEESEPGSPVMQEEIFGPILPIIPFDDIREPVDYIRAHEKPLALYYFGKSRQAVEVLNQLSSGGGCINDTVLQFANHHLPFGGVGNSGQGKYHGYNSFLAFSNSRAFMKTPTWIDLPARYVPFRYFKWVKKIL